MTLKNELTGLEETKRQGKANTMEKYLYEAILYPVDNVYEAAIPELNLITQGNDLADAVFMAQDVLALAISSRLADGEHVPPVGTFKNECREGTTLIGIATFAEPTKALEDYMTVQEAADVLDISRSRIYAMVNEGILDTKKEGNMRLVSATDVMDVFNNPRMVGRPKKVALA